MPTYDVNKLDNGEHRLPIILKSEVSTKRIATEGTVPNCTLSANNQNNIKISTPTEEHRPGHSRTQSTTNTIAERNKDFIQIQKDRRHFLLKPVHHAVEYPTIIDVLTNTQLIPTPEEIERKTGCKVCFPKVPPQRSRPRKSLSSSNQPIVSTRLASLRARKDPTPVNEGNQSKRGRKKSDETNKKEEQSRGINVTVFNQSFLDEEDLNKIEIIEYKDKKIDNKRKRTGRSYIIPNKPKKAKKRTSKNNENTITTKFNKSQETESDLESPEAENTDMSMYERRYPEEEGGRNVVTNGFLNSTRNSVGSGGGAHSDTDAQDITNHYFVPAVSNPIASTIANNNNNNNNNVINHASSMATLCNIGNTCYLNSVVYTLRFAPQFLHNLHHLVMDLHIIQKNMGKAQAKSSSLGRGVTSVHMESARSWSNKDLASLEMTTNSGNVIVAQKSPHQLLTECLHELYQSLHQNEVSESPEPFQANTLLHAIQDVSTIFEGNQQQDAHEFLMCVLNSIRETTQLLVKLINEAPEIFFNSICDNSSDSDVAVYAHEKDSVLTTNISQVSSNTSSTNSNTTNFAKASFFSRKSKRKEESKNSKSSRLQSPLKDNGSSATSNSLFYLNTVDVTSNGMQSNMLSPSSITVPNKSTCPAADDDVVEPLAADIIRDKDRLSEKIREMGFDFFKEDFEGITVSTTKCLSCETITEQKESMINIAVPVPISGYESSDYTEKPGSFIQNSCITREYFRGENKYRCEQCTGYTEAIRSISYEVLPRLLVIQLSRFSGGMEKINSFIPTSFTLQCFCSKCCELSDENKLHVYKLYSVITHVGATMSVGHYIAYTCSLDFSNEYLNCPKDRRTSYQQSKVGFQNNGTYTQSSSTLSSTSNAASAAASALASSGTSLMKKMKFVRNKASSSGDMSKNMKHLNGMTHSSKSITNDIGKLSMNTTCQSLNCCATRVCSLQHQVQHQQHQTHFNNILSDESLQNGINSANPTIVSTTVNSFHYGSTGRSTGTSGMYKNASSGNANLKAGTEPIWYMCDDDKIKAMTQREFEELLSPSRKITITPYLLFYARFDLSSTKSSASKLSSTNTTTSSSGIATGTSTSQSSWTTDASHKM